MIFKILLLLGLSSLSAFLYRRGGTNKGTLWRDVGCSLVTLVALWLLLGFKLSYWWAYLLTFGLSWGSLTTYHKWLNKFFGKNKDDCYWWNWLAHGLVIGFVCLPIIYTGIVWWIILFRAIVLGIAMMIWSERIGKVDLEESGRGALIILTLSLLLL